MAQRTPEQQHKRQVSIQIILPMIVVLLVFILGMVLFAIVLDPTQISLVMDYMAIIFCLIPAVLICLIPSLGLLAASLWVAFSADKAQAPLARGRLSVLKYLNKAQEYAPRIAQPVAAAQAKLTYWETMLGIRPPTDGAEEKQEHER